ncbi:hypothetical protein BDQ12DRAFT_617124 [Crucibulum laeve]|uniref:BZIP domain-containing protein n=1 Tax=Crucibulum laeve TaxID=68775 RepID=A0A5C3LIG1_9AGAR|nr:hypothetical protein BDQ12DRAFT_617124 [Crucibulum laeve]
MSVTGHTAHSERPERSRNAKAQARHRAKRKAYIEQLETTVTKLQTALGFSPEQVAALPPPLIKIRELEQENTRLQKENEELRRMLNDSGTRNIPVDIARRNSFGYTDNIRPCDRDYKRRKMSGHVDGPLQRPPPLSIPQPMSHHYGNIASNGHSNSSAMFSLHAATTFQMPNTPSGSSATSSPPFSAMTLCVLFPPLQPAQMQAPSHPPPQIHQRNSGMSNHHNLSGYSQHSNHYEPVKVEEDGYGVCGSLPPHQNHAQTSHYPMQSYANTSPQNGMENWHAYSSERAHIHR